MKLHDIPRTDGIRPWRENPGTVEHLRVTGVINLGDPDDEETEYEQLDPDDDMIPEWIGLYVYDEHGFADWLDDFNTPDAAIRWAQQHYPELPLYDYTYTGNHP